MGFSTCGSLPHFFSLFAGQWALCPQWPVGLDIICSLLVVSWSGPCWLLSQLAPNCHANQWAMAGGTCEGNTAMRPLLTRVHSDGWAEGDIDFQVHWHSGYPQSITTNDWIHEMGLYLMQQLSSEIKLRGAYCIRWNIWLLGWTSPSRVQIIALGMWIRCQDQLMIT